LRYEGWTLGGH